MKLEKRREKDVETQAEKKEKRVKENGKRQNRKEIKRERVRDGDDMELIYVNLKWKFC